MNKEIQYWEWDTFVTKLLIWCGLEPKIITHLEFSIFAKVGLKSGAEVNIHPHHYPNLKEFDIYIVCSTPGKGELWRDTLDTPQELKDWVEANKNQIESGLVDYSDMK